ncbi:MAG: hypothetical protein P8Y58_05870 [Novosphingobium sp.]
MNALVSAFTQQRQAEELVAIFTQHEVPHAPIRFTGPCRCRAVCRPHSSSSMPGFDRGHTNYDNLGLESFGCFRLHCMQLPGPSETGFSHAQMASLAFGFFRRFHALDRSDRRS